MAVRILHTSVEMAISQIIVEVVIDDAMAMRMTVRFRQTPVTMRILSLLVRHDVVTMVMAVSLTSMSMSISGLIRFTVGDPVRPVIDNPIRLAVGLVIDNPIRGRVDRSLCCQGRSCHGGHQDNASQEDDSPHGFLAFSSLGSRDAGERADSTVDQH